MCLFSPCPHTIIPEKMISFGVNTVRKDILVNKYITVTMDKAEIKALGSV